MAAPRRDAVPLLGFAEAGSGGYFDDGGFPAGEGWDEIAFPAVTDAHAYALEVSGQSMEPAYRERRHHRCFTVGADAAAATASWCGPGTAR